MRLGWIKVGLGTSKLEEYWECLEKHYSNYDVPTLDSKVNGLRTRTENLADHLGLLGITIISMHQFIVF